MSQIVIGFFLTLALGAQLIFFFRFMGVQKELKSLKREIQALKQDNQFIDS